MIRFGKIEFLVDSKTNEKFYEGDYVCLKDDEGNEHHGYIKSIWHVTGSICFIENGKEIEFIIPEVDTITKITKEVI